MAAASLTPKQIATIKATVPFLQQYGAALTTRFYDALLEAYPDLRNVFSATDQVTGAQPRALAASLLAYARHVDDLSALRSAVEHIAQRHVSLQVAPAQYLVVRHHLLETLAQMLGELAVVDAQAIVAAWKAAYDVLAEVLIAREGELYDDTSNDGISKEGADTASNWVGWRKLRVARRVAETKAIVSFYLTPMPGEPTLPCFLPGQYISVRVFVPALGRFQIRQYSLSAAPRATGDYYRISAMRDKGREPGMPGMVSNLLHDSLNVGDEIEVARPRGNFVLDPWDARMEGASVVLISAGIGATPMMAILGGLVPEFAAEEPGVWDAGAGKGDGCRLTVRRPISWIQGARTSAALPFRYAVRRACTITPHSGGISACLFVREVAPTDREGVDYDFGGVRIDLALLDKDRDLHLGDARAEYYVCGPESFMRDMRRSLVGMGVEKNRIRLELFGTGDVAEDD